MYSLLYVSESLLPRGQAADAIRAIVSTSTTRNAAAGVTGALLYTGMRFAQWLEGEEAAVRDIMASIARDARHRNVTLLEQNSTPERRFSSWSLVYLGHSTFAAATVERALAEAEAGDGFARRSLVKLLQELAHSQPAPPAK